MTFLVTVTLNYIQEKLLTFQKSYFHKTLNWTNYLHLKSGVSVWCFCSLAFRRELISSRYRNSFWHFKKSYFHLTLNWNQRSPSKIQLFLSNASLAIFAVKLFQIDTGIAFDISKNQILTWLLTEPKTTSKIHLWV